MDSITKHNARVLFAVLVVVGILAVVIPFLMDVFGPVLSRISR
jgi:hypothetical protein